MVVAHPADDGGATAVRHVHVDEHHVGQPLADELDRGIHLRCVADEIEEVPDLGPHSGAEQLVVVDDEHPRRFAGHPRPGRGSSSRISVPSPIRDRITASPP